MKKLVLFLVPALLMMVQACEVTAPDAAGPKVDFPRSLTQAETDGGIMSPEILWKFGRVGGMALSPDGQTVLYTVSYYDVPTEQRESQIYAIPTEGGEPVQLTTEGGYSPSWKAGNETIGFLRGRQLWEMNADGSGQKQISEVETGIESYAYSADGSMIWFSTRVKMDQTPNEKHGMDKANMRIIDDLMFRHWDYWHDYAYSHVFTAEVQGSKLTGIKDILEGEKFESPTAPWFDGAEVSWSPDGKYIAYTCKKLSGKEDAVSTNTDIYLYELASGETVNISEGMPGFDKFPVFSPDSRKIAWQSMEEAGYESDLGRLFIYDMDSGEKSWLSEGWDYNVENFFWSSGGDNIWFTSPYRGTVQLFTISMAEGEVSQITEGVHNVAPVALENGVMTAQLQSMKQATEIVRIDPADGSITPLTAVNQSIYEHIAMGNTEERWITTKDNEQLHMWIIYPPDFDPEKKYPAILYCKGGPQGALSQSWSYRWNYQMMAANGYIVVAPTRRGTSGFGSEWREQISGDYGGKNMQDYLDAIDAMAKEPFVDENRLGAVGASYGGFSIFYLAGIHENRFKAMISHCGMFNFESWYGSTEELWFPNKDIEGPYWQKPKPKSYDYSPHLMVDKWTAPLLIIVGEHDYRIPYTQSLEAFTAAQLHGVPSRLLFFHDETHFVTHPQNAIIWQREFFAWLDEYLK